MKTNRRIIVLCGTVGAGKSTLGYLLSYTLRKHNIKIRKTTLKTSHGLSHIVLYMLYKMVTRKRDAYPIRALIDEKTLFFRRLFKLWIILDIISVYIEFIKRVLIPLKLRYNVVIEEFIPAIITDYIYLARKLSVPLASIYKFLKIILKLNYLVVNRYYVSAVFLNAELNELERRWILRGSPKECIDYILVQRSILYRMLNLLYNSVIYIDTTHKSVNATYTELKIKLSI